MESLQKWLKNIDSFSYDNAINYDWIQKTDNKFFREYQEGEMIMKEEIKTFKMKKQLEDGEEKMMLETNQIFMVLIITPFKKFEEAFQEGNYRPMVKWVKKLQPWLKKF